MMRIELVKLISEKLEREVNEIRQDFKSEKGIKTHFAIIDNFLPENIARKIFIAFPKFEEMTFLDNFREKKYTSKNLKDYKSLIVDLMSVFHHRQIIQKIADMFEIKDLYGDPNLFEGRISAMAKGHFLNPHLDNSHDSEQKNYRVLNLVYYCSPDWKADYGGNLELWNEEVTEAIEIPSLFNRLVLMSTNDKSWHSVNEVKKDSARCCISNYYFSPHSPNGYETTHVTYFKARPEQKLRRLLTKADSDLRNILRKVKKSSFSKKDIDEDKK